MTACPVQSLVAPVRAALGALLLVACSYDLDGAAYGDLAPSNICDADADCGSTGQCLDGRCVASGLEYDEILVEVLVPGSASSGSYAGSRFFRNLTGLAAGGGLLDVDVPRLSRLTFALTPPPCVDAIGEAVHRVGGECPAGSLPESGRPACRYDFSRVPLEVTLTPTARALGIATERYTEVTCHLGVDCEACVGADCPVPAAAMDLPPGDYEAYLRVDPQVTEIPDGICEVVPEVVPLTVPEDTGLTFDYQLGEPTLLPIEVEWDTLSGAPGALSGWSVDMLDGLSARRISNRVLLGEPTTDTELERYAATLEFLTTAAPGNEATELVRLVPPPDVVAPTIVVERSSLGLLGGPAVLDQMTALPAPVVVEGQLLAKTDLGGSEQLSPVGGTVTLIATAIDGLPTGALAAFQRTVTAGEDEADQGVFQATLLPGKYRVRVVPSGSCRDIAPCADGTSLCDCPLGATEVDEWIVAPSPAVQAGKTVELAWRTRVAGSVLGASGEPIAGAPIQATAVPTSPTALATALGTEAFVPRASSGTVASDGSFELRADAGNFDLTVRPDASTGFAWLVRPGVPVELGEPNLDLGSLNMPLPVAFSGAVRVAADRERDGIDFAALPGAVLRAYLAVDAGPVVQVAEATADNLGFFELLLPEHLERAW